MTMRPLAWVCAAVLLAGCQEFPESSTAPTVAKPGDLLVQVAKGNTATAFHFTLKGGPIEAPRAADSTVTTVFTDSVGGTLHVIAIGRPSSGALLRFGVLDTNHSGDYVATIQEVASSTGDLLDTSSHDLGVTTAN